MRTHLSSIIHTVVHRRRANSLQITLKKYDRLLCPGNSTLICSASKQRAKETGKTQQVHREGNIILIYIYVALTYAAVLRRTLNHSHQSVHQRSLRSNVSPPSHSIINIHLYSPAIFCSAVRRTLS